ncbi:MAG: tRNA (adenosine(37)-N6)-threonylcarbamoyltransferase complex ATPase subunit type 1 TsaE [Gammaproteobacteria bacterium]|nr:tRNA (adenosine(37)-N6)-threonylcarbamoyltransferase complex ATPase subunit type 1 TsaE [Gammaproteobacteria bacterium]
MGIERLSRRVALRDEAATLALGGELVRELDSGVVYLCGELGAGKTTLVRGYLRALGFEGMVKSPTYTLVEPYEIDDLSIAHLDLYRVTDPVELEYIGIEDVLRDVSLTFIEWPERGKGYLPAADLIIDLEIDNGGRVAQLNAV